MTQRDSDRGDKDWSDERRARLVSARLASDQDLRDASEREPGGARRLLVPALWGAAIVGGGLLALAVLRLARRPRARPALLRVSIQPRLETQPLLPAIGGFVARLALQHLLAGPSREPSLEELLQRSAEASDPEQPAPTRSDLANGHAPA